MSSLKLDLEVQQEGNELGTKAMEAGITSKCKHMCMAQISND